MKQILVLMLMLPMASWASVTVSGDLISKSQFISDYQRARSFKQWAIETTGRSSSADALYLKSLFQRFPALARPENPPKLVYENGILEFSEGLSVIQFKPDFAGTLGEVNGQSLDVGSSLWPFEKMEAIQKLTAQKKRANFLLSPTAFAESEGEPTRTAIIAFVAMSQSPSIPQKRMSRPEGKADMSFR